VEEVQKVKLFVANKAQGNKLAKMIFYAISSWIARNSPEMDILVGLH
jgi:hypothetical protein